MMPLNGFMKTISILLLIKVEQKGSHLEEVAAVSPNSDFGIRSPDGEPVEKSEFGETASEPLRGLEAFLSILFGKSVKN